MGGLVHQPRAATDPEKPTVKPKYVVMYFLGAEHLVECFIPMWDRIHAQLHTNKIVGRRVPQRLGRQRVPRGVPADRREAGYKMIAVGALPRRDHQLLLDDLPVQGVRRRLLHQRAAAARLRHHVEAVGPAGLQAEAGDRGQGAAVPARRLRARAAWSYNVATDAWWAPSLPWKSSFTGETCQQLANEFEAATNGQWNSNISNYSLFEAAHAALIASVSDPHDKTEVAAAIHKVNLPQAVARPLNFASGGPRRAWRSPRRSASSGRRARSSRLRPRSWTTRCSRRRRSPPTLQPTNK